MSLFSFSAKQSAQAPLASASGYQPAGSAACAHRDSANVGEHRLIRFAVLRRRARFVGRFIYWTCRHGSPKHAGWVANYEGLYW